MNQEHIVSLISDYTLDLLKAADRLRVEEHTAVCAACRQALQREKQMALSIGHTLHLATQPANGRLQALMPTPPRRATRQPRVMRPQINVGVAAWSAQLAPMMVLVLLAGTLWLYLMSPRDPWNNNTAGYFAMTETATATVTATSSATLPPTASPVATIAEGPTLQTPNTPTTPTSQTAATPEAGGGD